MDNHNLRDFEIIEGNANNVFGLCLRDGESGEVHTWWVTNKDLARLHGRIHWQLNLGNHALDEMAGIGPPGQYS